jgi:hypothetical protein
LLLQFLGLVQVYQKTYGLWGLYSVPARVSGLLADGPVGLTPWAREFVEDEYVGRLRPAERQLEKLVQDGLTLRVNHERSQRPDVRAGNVLGRGLDFG